MLFPLSILFGALGLTGGGGSLLAVLMLVVAWQMPAAVLQKVFTMGIVAVAIFIVSKTFV